MRTADARVVPSTSVGASASEPGDPRVVLHQSDRCIVALRDQQPVGTVQWAQTDPSEGLDLSIEMGSNRDPEVACVLLDRALTELGERGVPKVRLALTVGEPQTPGMLQIVRGQRTAASSAEVVAGTDIRPAGQTALVDVRLHRRSARSSTTKEG